MFSTRFVLFSSLALTLLAVFALADEKMTLQIGVRVYDGKMCGCKDKKARLLSEALKLGGDKGPLMRKLKDGKEEPYLLDTGNAWVLATNAKGEMHGYLFTSDGFVAIDTKHPNPVEEVSGQNYDYEFAYISAPTSFKKLAELGQRLTNEHKEHGFNKVYKGTHFVIDFVLQSVDPNTAAQLKSSSAKFPKALQYLDNIFFEKGGDSAFDYFNIKRTKVPSLGELKPVNPK